MAIEISLLTAITKIAKDNELDVALVEEGLVLTYTLIKGGIKSRINYLLSYDVLVSVKDPLDMIETIIKSMVVKVKASSTVVENRPTI